MNSYAKYIRTVIEKEPENKLLEASALYQRSFGTVPEKTYYKTLERMLFLRNYRKNEMGNLL